MSLTHSGDYFHQLRRYFHRLLCTYLKVDLFSSFWIPTRYVLIKENAKCVIKFVWVVIIMLLETSPEPASRLFIAPYPRGLASNWEERAFTGENCKFGNFALALLGFAVIAFHGAWSGVGWTGRRRNSVSRWIELINRSSEGRGEDALLSAGNNIEGLWLPKRKKCTLG